MGSAAADDEHGTPAGAGWPWQRVPSAWHTGPTGHAYAYAVTDPAGETAGRQAMWRAERRTVAGDPVGYGGPAALKAVIDGERGHVEQLRRRWEMLRAIDHPQLARALEVFRGPPLFRGEPPDEAEGEVWYSSTVWAEGRTLRVAAPLAPDEAIGVVDDLAGALSVLHASGIVHRDVHPGNVVLGERGAVLIDFGSARPDDGCDTVTVSGSMGFIAPECLHGTGRAAADRWALGMVLVFALLGHPQGSAPRDALLRELTGVLDGIADPGRAVRLIGRMLDPEPAARPRDPCAWAGELRECLSCRQRRPGRAATTAVALGVLATTAMAATVVAMGDRTASADVTQVTAHDVPGYAVAGLPAREQVTCP
jgi:hypothetical protein